MIKIVPHFMRVRNGESGEFVDYLVIKGAPGTIENLSYFTTNETGDSENLVITQKGVTDIHDKLLSGEMMVGSADYANYATYAERAEFDVDDNPIAATYATKAALTSGKVVPKKAETAATATKADHADTATEAALADTANKLNASGTTAANSYHASYLPIVFVEGTGANKKTHSSNALAYKPSTQTLKVKTLEGKATEATHADTATTADKLSSKSFETATATFTIANGTGTSTKTIMPGLYLTEFTQNGGEVYTGILLIRTSEDYTLSVGSFHFSIDITDGNKCTIAQMYYANGDRAYYNGTLTFYKISS